MTTKAERFQELLRRGGKDPLRFSKATLAEVLKDEIPYKKWERQLNLLRRAGFKSWNHYLKTMEKRKFLIQRLKS